MSLCLEEVCDCFFLFVCFFKDFFWHRHLYLSSRQIGNMGEGGGCDMQQMTESKRVCDCVGNVNPPTSCKNSG